MQTVDRIDLIAYSQGILIDRRADGTVFAPDEMRCEQAVEAMESGETIALMSSGRIVSYCRVMDGAFVEYEKKGK